MIVILGALLIGLSLGLLGSGGSILTVPVLVYLLGHDDKIAVAESLAIVGGIALVSALPYARSRQIDWRSVVLFGLPGMAGTYGGGLAGEVAAGGGATAALRVCHAAGCVDDVSASQPQRRRR